MGEVSEIITSIGIGKLDHKDMIVPMSSLIADLIFTGKAGLFLPKKLME
jgi:hypothetical protein